MQVGKWCADGGVLDSERADAGSRCQQRRHHAEDCQVAGFGGAGSEDDFWRGNVQQVCHLTTCLINDALRRAPGSVLSRARIAEVRAQCVADGSHRFG